MLKQWNPLKLMPLLSAELTHEFLQILEKTPSRLKRIRNWRVSPSSGSGSATGSRMSSSHGLVFFHQAIQAAKKPKTDSAAVDNAFQGGSLDSLPQVSSYIFPVGPSSNSSNSSDMPSLKGIAGPFAAAAFQPLGFDHFAEPQQPHLDLAAVVKHEHRLGGGASGKQQHAVVVSTPSRQQKVLTLEKYREKQQAAEMALLNGGKEELVGGGGGVTDVYAQPGGVSTSASSHHHKKRPQPPLLSPPGDGRSHKSASKKSRGPASFAENSISSSGANEELKMRIKVSAERHGDPSKDKHKEHHRHGKHGYAPADKADPSGSSSSRKRPHPDSGNHHNNNNHHHASKRSSKGGLGSAHYTLEGSGKLLDQHHNHHHHHYQQHHHGHHSGATNGLLAINGQHTDYKNTFDMLDSLLSAQGMNL